MKISLEWLSDFVKLPEGLSAEQIQYSLTMATVEVEQVTHLAESLARVVVGKVLEVDEHPTADRLRLVRCDLGGGKSVEVVSAGSDLRSGALVAVALPGASVRGRGGEGVIAVEEREVQGVMSSGMICGAHEVGLEHLFPVEEMGVLELSVLDVEPGTSLAEAIGFDDVIFEIDNKSLTNRPDLLGHRGIARELSAIYSAPFEPLPKLAPPAVRGDLEVRIDDPERCRRYTATLIDGITAAQSPPWLRSRLVRVGQRPINLSVDLTNYVMLAIGQPSHAFETGRLEGAIRVRQAGPREELPLLDGETVALDESALVIADDRHAVGLAGIMGGESTSVREGSSGVVLEMASFEPGGVRRTATRLGLRTESSMRFEKGLDPGLIDDALAYFLDALARAAPDARALAFTDDYPLPLDPPTVHTTVEFINRRLGADFSCGEIQGILERLGFEVALEGGDLTVVVPSWRATGDVSLPEDLVEEVGRLYGYENLEYVAPQIVLERIVRQPSQRLERRLREYLAGPGAMQEIVSYPWVEDRYLEAAGCSPPLRLATPPAPEAGRLQSSLVPQMLSAIKSNLRFLEAFRLFEVARVFPSGSLGPLHEGGEPLPPQPKSLAAALVGPDAGRLFLEAKGLLEALGREVQMEPLGLVGGDEAAWAEPTGHLTVALGEEPVGRLGLVAARAMRIAGIRHAKIALFELDLGLLRPFPSRQNRFEPLPTHPQKDYDLALVVPVEVRWSDLHRVMDSAHELIQSVRLAEEYRGEQIPAGKKSLLVQVRMGTGERTLESNEIEEIAAALTGSVSKELGAEVRGSVPGTTESDGSGP